MKWTRCSCRCGGHRLGLALVLGLCVLRLDCAWGYAELRIYRPAGATLGTNEYAFWGTETSPYAMVPGVTSSKAVANVNSGGVAVFSGAWVGAATARAGYYVGFTVPEACHVYATLKFVYTGDTEMFGFASWAGTAWGWRLDNGRWHEEDIAAAFTLETVGGKALDLALLAAGGVAFPEKVEAIIELIDKAWSLYQLSQELIELSLGNHAVRVEKTVHFTVAEGTHKLALGLRASGSALLTGSSFAFLLGQVEEIRLGLNSEEGLYPDLAITGITVPDEAAVLVDSVVELEVERSNIGNALATPETFELRTMPTNGMSSILIRGASSPGIGSGFRSIPAYLTETERVRHVFHEKGTYVLLGWEDPDDRVVELDELNNQSFKVLRVCGRVPSAPGLIGTFDAWRNRTLPLDALATETDGDVLRYRYEIRPVGSPDWRVITNGFNPVDDGWSRSAQLSVTPVLADGDLWPAAGGGVDARSYVVFATNEYRIRAQAADEDGASAYSAEMPFRIMLNTVPTVPAVVGDSFSDTLKGVSITARSSDVEGDRMAFRFDWGEGIVPAWTDWVWCEPGSNAVTVVHQYATSARYCVGVEATDLYSMRYTVPVQRSAAASHCIWIAPYVAPTNALVVITADQGRGERLPGVEFVIGGDTNLTGVTGAQGYWQGSVLPGTYTVWFAAVAGFRTPGPVTRVLPYRSSVEFDGDYEHEAGTISVRCNIAGRGRIVGEGTALGDNHVFSGQSWSATGVWAGPHVVEFEPVEAETYGVPSPVRSTNVLVAGGTIEFRGRYLRRPVVVARAIYPTNAYEPAGAFVLVNEEAVELDASGSYSPVQPTGDGVFPELVLSVQGYRFGFDDGPDYAEDVEQGARDGVCDGKVRHVFRRTGRRSVTVTAVDSAGCSSRASAVEVWVQERPVAIVEVEPSPAIAGEAVGFGARGTDGDPGDTIVGYEWVSSVAGLLSTNVVFERNDLQVGVHEIRLRVVGSDGVWSEPARAFLEVCVPQEWPVFKRTPARVSNQPGYAGRDSGQLPYGVAGDGWPFYADGAIEGSPVVADLDGDWVNGLEVAFVSRPGTLYVVDSKGFRRWSVAVGVSSSTPAIGDVNRDCRPEIVVGSRGGVRAFDARGTLLFAYAVSGGGGFEYSMPVIADVDPGVSGLEVAVTADHGGVHLIYSDGTGGTNGWPFRYGASGTEAQMFASAPAVAELEPSRYGREVVVGGMDGRLYLLDRHGSNIADFAVAGAAPIHTTPVVADVCPPVPGPEVVFGADDGVCYCVNYSNGAFTPVWQFAVSPVARIRSSPAVGMAGEGAGTQVVFGCDNGTVYLLNGTNGMQIGSYSCGAGVPVRSTPAVADIDTVRFTAPNRPEVLVAATDGVLHAINFSWGGTAVWTNRVSAMPIVGSPAVADIDHNPDLEVLVGASDNGLYVLAARPDPAQVPVVDFSGLPISGGRPLSVVFTNLTLVTNSPAMLGFWRWEFGDGSTSMDRDPVHVYELPGSYTVTLTARNAHGSRTVTKEDMVTVAPVPLADFAVSAEAGAVPLTVRFSSTARFEPSGWVWDFGDGSGSVLEHPDHTYTEPGFYTVSLTVSNGNGAETLVRSNCVLARATCPVADFTMNVTNGCAPLTVQFRDLSSAGPAGWCWDFGDGSASSERNPIHGYEAPGRYLVSLTVTNAAGANTRTGTEYLAVQPAAATGEMTLMDLGLEEGTGWIAHDASGNGNDGTIVGATWVAAELGGWALAFSGGGQWTDGDGVTVPYAPSMGAVGPFRVEAWIKASGLDHYLAIVDQYDPSATPGPSGYTLYLTGGRLRFSIYSGSAGGESGWGTTELRDDRWHRVAGVWDGEGLSAVVDGVVEGTTPWPHPPGQCEAALGIGKRLSGWGGYMPFRGAIDGVRVVQILEVEPLGVSVERSGGLAVVTWSACAVLQWAPTPMGPWADLAGAGSPVLIRVEGPCRFYRLRGLQGP